mmetsp:Transcript_50674/g.156880  ORF Transcript_50674/g.156880 Transcript_50674/m.156880 type:complete len:254 (+) Transcript_50674:459-1220(+)
MFHCDLIADDVEAKHAGVLVEQAEGLELVSAAHVHLVSNCIDNAVARDGPRDQALALLVGAHDRLHDHEGHGVRAPPRHGLPAHRDVGRGAHLVVPVDELGTAEVRLRHARCGGAGLHAAKRRRRQLHKLLMLHRARSCEDHLVGGVVGVHVACQVGLREGLGALEGPDAGEAQGAVAEGARVQAVVDDRACRLLHLVQRPQDAVLLLLEAADGRARHDVGEDVDALREVLVRDGDGVGGLLAAGRHAHHATD